MAKLKALPLRDVRTIAPWKRMSMRACRPRRGTIARWHAVNDRLAALVERRRGAWRWGSLAPDLQETLCVEFLRNHGDSHLPRMAHLLMPFGRTMKDVDIVGLDAEGKRIFAQVTHYSEDASLEKIVSLKKYAHSQNRLILFCQTPESKRTGGLWVVPTDMVWQWARNRRGLISKILQM